MKLFWLILLVVVLLMGCQPTCGDGIVETGETSDNCCEDTGCVGDQVCNNGCQDPICGECEFLENHVCVAYECCDNSACANTQKCDDNKCVDLRCGDCEYAEDHSCASYVCCEDKHCQSNQACRDNTCVPVCEDGTFYGECSPLKPYYCNNGELQANCEECGCYGDNTCLLNTNTCTCVSDQDCRMNPYRYCREIPGLDGNLCCDNRDNPMTLCK